MTGLTPALWLLAATGALAVGWLVVVLVLCVVRDWTEARRG